MYIERVVLDNVRCFEHLEVDFVERGESVLIAGDNGDGKSTLLRSIAMGLCDESSAAALFRELPGEFVRKGAEDAHIDILLRDGKGTRYQIKTMVQSLTAFERVSQKVFVVKDNRSRKLNQDVFPWERVFVCGYGAGRQTQGTSNIDEYAAVDAVYTLFRYYEPLRNPELAVHRLLEKARAAGTTPAKGRSNAHLLRARLLDILKRVLNLDKRDKVLLTHNGIEVQSHWGRTNLHSLGDGYGAVTTFILDFVSCRMLSSRSLDPGDIKGIMLIDEVEQHLHPRWQLRIMELLKQAFPKVQFLATTHSPLVISGCRECRVHTLNRGRHRAFGRVFGWLAEDIYREIMGLPNSRARSFSDQVLDRYEALYQKRAEGKLSEKEHVELSKLRRRLKELPESDPIKLTTEIASITEWLRSKRRQRS